MKTFPKWLELTLAMRCFVFASPLLPPASTLDTYFSEPKSAVIIQIHAVNGPQPITNLINPRILDTNNILFRPIVLCIVSYRVISELDMNRVSPGVGLNWISWVGSIDKV